MRRIVWIAGFLVVTESVCGGGWPQWRGPNQDGTSLEKSLPVEWGKDKNVQWMIRLPGPSGSTPIISGERIFLQVAEGRELALWAVDIRNGTVLWKRRVDDSNFALWKHNMSSPSPVTDGTRVFVLTGTGVLKAFSHDGVVLWRRNLQKDYGAFGLEYGYASSPLLHGNGLYIQVLHGFARVDWRPIDYVQEAPSYILRIDVETGRTVWRKGRRSDAAPKSSDAYSTPTVLQRGERVEVIVTGADCVTANDSESGEELWRFCGLNPDNLPNSRLIVSPVVRDGFVFASGNGGPLVALRPGEGSLKEPQRIWSFERGSGIPTPATDGVRLYLLTEKGILWCLDARTGERIWGPERARPSEYHASPLLADGKLYVTSIEGVTTVIRAGGEFEVLAENDLWEEAPSAEKSDIVETESPMPVAPDYQAGGIQCQASLAVGAGRIVVRTSHYLYSIGRPEAGEAEQ